MTAEQFPRHSNRTERLGRHLGALALIWVCYSLVRAATADEWTQAMENANEILRLQSALGLPAELGIQRAIVDNTRILMAANVYYLAAHFPVTVAFLAWVWFRDLEQRARVIQTLVLATSSALVLHVLYPLAPPRFLDGFVDTAALIGPDPYSLGVAGVANQIAAMPSMHVGWALLVAIGISRMSDSRWRNLAFAHPVITTVVVIVTANHYWLDAIIGAVLVLAAWWLTTLVTRSQRTDQPAPPSPPPIRQTVDSSC